MSRLSEFDRLRMDEVTAGVGDNKSEKMRRLAAAGFSRGDIARYLGVRYQFVRNVLVAAEQAAEKVAGAAEEVPLEGAEGDSSKTPPLTSDEAGRRSAESAPKWLWITVGRDGIVRLPPAYLAALGAAEGDQVQLALQRDQVRILGRASALRELREEVRRYVPEGVSLVDELLAERRTEAVRENGA